MALPRMRIGVNRRGAGARWGGQLAARDVCKAADRGDDT